jgi:hypothetical protein
MNTKDNIQLHSKYVGNPTNNSYIFGNQIYGETYAKRLFVRDQIIELKKKSCLYRKMIPFLEPKFQEPFNLYIIPLLCLNHGHGRGTDLSIISDPKSLKILI